MSTGIPPHSLLLGYIRGLKESFNGLPAKIEAMMDRRESGRNGRLSLGEIMNAIEEAPMMTAVLNDIASIKRVIADRDGVRGTVGNSSRTERSSGQTLRLLHKFSHGGND